MGKSSRDTQLARAQALLGQPRNPSPELTGHLEKISNKLYPYYRNNQVPNTSSHLPKDPSWVHIGSDFSMGVLSFHHLRGGELQVHSTSKIDWDRESWLLFSAAHQKAIEVFEHRKVRNHDLRRMKSQVFSDSSFTVGYGSDPAPAPLFGGKQQLNVLGVGLAAGAAALILTVSQLEVLRPFLFSLTILVDEFLWLALMMSLFAAPVVILIGVCVLAAVMSRVWERRKNRREWNRHYGAFLPSPEQRRSPALRPPRPVKTRDFMSKSNKNQYSKKKSSVYHSPPLNHSYQRRRT